MKPKPPHERVQKRSISFPPELWEFIVTEAGEYGNPSRVVQKAVREMKSRIEESAGKYQAQPKRGERK